ncbi:MAG: hypothetical protein NC037_04940 [Bacteroides sp.]|nr:hypothetical protein [Bacillota bacterium]MCM1394073.1 hypothetical protein [[Eubacterium] siraeum]MCM1455857.1 hypothetical protein [Bacteroides sp.]
MNNKKRVLLIALIAVLVTVMAFMLVACNGSLQEQIRDLQNKVNGYEADFSEKSIVVYIGEDKFEITTRKAFLHDVFKEMKASGKISAYTYNGGDASPYCTQIGNLPADGTDYKYYSVWHSVDEYAFKSVYNEYMPSRAVQKVENEGTDWEVTFAVTTYEETLLFYSNVGVGYIPVVEGATYAILVD